MTIDNKDGAAFLAYVTDKLETRIAHISQSILEGQKDIEGMHEYYWENYTEMPWARCRPATWMLPNGL